MTQFHAEQYSRQTMVVFLMAAITNALGVKLVRLGWSMKNSLVVVLVQLSIINNLDLIP